jgi:hypothetical protein
MVLAKIKKITYTQFDVTIALTGNPNRDEIDPIPTKNNLFLSDGIDQNLAMVFTIKMDCS